MRYILDNVTVREILVEYINADLDESYEPSDVVFHTGLDGEVYAEVTLSS